MPRLAFALPYLPEREEEWRAVASAVADRRAREHRSWLLERGIFRERVWVQRGEGSPSVSLVLWDCDDVEVATRVDAPDGPSPHERWLCHTVLQRYHGRRIDDFTFPATDILSGTTTRATAVAEAQRMVALPIPDEGVPALRQLVERIEHGDLAGPHTRFLVDAGIREEWVWVQPAQADAPAMLLLYWIGDDLQAAWDRLTTDAEDPYVRILRTALFSLIAGTPPATVARWDVDQVLAMHVRRSDADPPSTQPLARRIRAAVTRRRWDALTRASHATVHVDGRAVPAAEAVDLVRRTVEDRDLVPTDVMSGDLQVVISLGSEDGAPGPALVLVVDDGAVARLHLLDTWPGA